MELDPLHDDNLLQIANNIRHWRLLAEQKLGFSKKVVDRIMKANNSDTERAHATLLAWRNTVNGLRLEQRIVKLEVYLEERGEEKACEKLRELVHVKPLGHRELLSDGHLRFIGAAVSDWKVVAERLSVPDNHIQQLSSRMFGKKMVPYEMLLLWFNDFSEGSMEEKVDFLANALFDAHEHALVDDIRDRQRLWLGCV